MTNNSGPPPLPPALHAVVVLSVLGLLAVNIWREGNEGYPTSMMLGGILVAYAGLAGIIKGRNGGGSS